MKWSIFFQREFRVKEYSHTVFTEKMIKAAGRAIVDTVAFKRYNYLIMHYFERTDIK